MPQQQPVALSVAGSDSGAGAGIQADLKTFSALGVYGLTVLTVVTAQSTSSVDIVETVPNELVRGQLSTVESDFVIGAMKSGALGNEDIIHIVAEFLQRHPELPFVLDPVMISKHGYRLIADEALKTLRDHLIPFATVVTPNLHEAAELAGMHEISSEKQMYSAAQAILALGCRNVIIKGGHSTENSADLLLGEAGELMLSKERIDSVHTHGTGCTFSAAITARLVIGDRLEDAFRFAKEYITGAIANAQVFGAGINPVNHFWRQDRQFGRVFRDIDPSGGEGRED
ncbi:bifunctional hydroxymethylpyrimidine kinase/phosphomethylpyrimidine kinase [bacterium]|nr:bifunctional hydroxymethylpyrimidine kinase/phosphomethylpyrimidine kinase [bacterium]